MAAREGLEFEAAIESDTAALAPWCAALLDAAGDGCTACATSPAAAWRAP